MYNKNYYQQNKERKLQIDREYYARNRNNISLKRRNRYKNDKKYRDKIIANQIRYGQENPTKTKESSKKYYEKHREKLSDKNKLYRNKNKLKLRNNNKNWRKRNPNYGKEYRNKNKDKINRNQREYYKKNKSKFRKYSKDKYNRDLNHKLATNLRARVRLALDGLDKSMNTLLLVGCSMDFLKEYLSNKFLPNMSWDNYGYDGWHIDHIIPCYKFNLSNKEEQLKCFNYTNLQPLWAKDNMAKGRLGIKYGKDKQKIENLGNKGID